MPVRANNEPPQVNLEPQSGAVDPNSREALVERVKIKVQGASIEILRALLVVLR